MTLTVDTAFLRERIKYVAQRGPNASTLDVVATIDVLWEAAQTAVYEENGKGGEARGVVAATASALGVDIDEGPGHRWDHAHMLRVVVAAKARMEELEHLRTTAAEDQRVLDDALEQTTRLSDERDEWKRLAIAGESLTKVRRAERERDDAVKRCRELTDEQSTRDRILFHGQPISKFVVLSGMFAAEGTEIAELKATIVRQANEITALKGESL